MRLRSIPDQYEFLNRLWQLRDPFGAGFTVLPDPPENICAGQKILKLWAEEEAWRQGLLPPPKGWRPATTPGVRGDGVLEGREMRLPRRGVGGK